jgi:peroxiredoxin
MSKLLPLGSKAPDFKLPVTPDQSLSLSELQGKSVILMFYPADWSPVCGDETALFNAVLPEFHKLGAELLGISVDGPWSHSAFAKHNKLHYSLLSDFEPKGGVSKLYGAYRDKEGMCERALFLIDKNGIIDWNYLSPVAENPGADGVLTALESLSKKENKHG